MDSDSGREGNVFRPDIESCRRISDSVHSKLQITRRSSSGNFAYVDGTRSCRSAHLSRTRDPCDDFYDNQGSKHIWVVLDESHTSFPLRSRRRCTTLCKRSKAHHRLTPSRRTKCRDPSLQYSTPSLRCRTHNTPPCSPSRSAALCNVRCAPWWTSNYRLESAVTEDSAPGWKIRQHTLRRRSAPGVCRGVNGDHVASDRTCAHK